MLLLHHPVQRLHTFGFRGEALSSLAALGELSVVTRTAEQVRAACVFCPVTSPL
jgi:DNA mismatch repair ATPase MutL